MRFLSAILLLSALLFSVSAWAECDFKSAEFIEELSDPSQIKHIGVTIHNSRKWQVNSLKILRDVVIRPKFKKNMKATLLVEYKFGTCEFAAKVRQNGDWLDHIKLAPGGHITASLNVSLKEGNILNATKFKLLRPETRNGINEILAVEFLKRLEILAPTSFLVAGGINDASQTFLFQAKIAKELLEEQNHREGPLFEGDETYMTNLPKNISWYRSMYYFSLTRLNNKKWAEKGMVSTDISLQAFLKIQKAYLDAVVNYNDTSSFLTPERSYQYNQFENYAVALYVIRGTHGLARHNRNYYFNSFLQSFEPVYYDGNVAFAKFSDDKELPLLLHKADADFIATALSEVEKLQNDVDFITIIAKYGGISVKKAEQLVRKKFGITKKNLLALQQMKQTLSAPIAKPQNDLAEKFVKNVLNDKIDMRVFQLVSTDLKNDTVIVKNLTAENQPLITLTQEELLILMADNQYQKKRAILLPDPEHKTEPTHEVIAFTHGDILISKGAKITINNGNKNIIFTQNKADDWMLMRNGALDGWHITLVGKNANDNVQQVQRFNNLGLTGCLNFYKTIFKNSRITANKGQCEDSVNLINSSGDLTTLTVNQAYADAVDLDFSTLVIDNAVIRNAGNDCFDVSGGTYHIKTGIFDDCGDKGISVGEKSNFTGDDITVSNASIGVSSKDFSTTQMASFTGNNLKACAEAFQKKQEFGGGILRIQQLTCHAPIEQDKHSIVDVKVKNEL
ncbi:MAG: hypothetical protein K0U39_03180 [Alphaproteobacteria bacterium]|nr:hypothetical protein [Alphaproteobacteria bacterium]